MNKESLTKLPILLQSMDENLSININEFVKNKIIQHLKLHPNKLIEVIKSSYKFNYDNKTGMIKYKEKADRNILMIRQFLKLEDDDKIIQEKKKFIKYLIEKSKLGLKYLEKIRKIDTVGDSFHFVFDHEDYSMDVEKYFLNKNEIKNESEFPKEFYNEFYNEFLNSEICLAAESLKRRIITNFNKEYNLELAQINYINSIVINPMKRRQTAHYDRRNKKSISPVINNRGSINDIKPRMHSKTIAGVNNIKRISTNKFRNSYVNNNNEEEIQNLPSTIQINRRQTIKVPSKFDLINYNNFEPSIKQRNKAFTLNNNNLTHINLLNQFTDRKSSYKIVNKNILDMLFSNDTESFDFRGPVIEQPNKESDSDNSEEYSSIGDTSVTCKYLYNLYLAYKYSHKEILSVFHHLNFINKFELPEEFNQNFITMIMSRDAKKTLEVYKKAKLSRKVRSNTLINKRQSSAKRGTTSKQSLSKFSLIENVLRNSILSRRRNASVSQNKVSFVSNILK